MNIYSHLQLLISPDLEFSALSSASRDYAKLGRRLRDKERLVGRWYGECAEEDSEESTRASSPPACAHNRSSSHKLLGGLDHGVFRLRRCAARFAENTLGGASTFSETDICNVSTKSRYSLVPSRNTLSSTAKRLHFNFSIVCYHILPYATPLPP